MAGVRTLVCLWLILAAGRQPGPADFPAALSVIQQPIIVDHSCADLEAIPAEWVEAAKDRLRLAYGHTSHGSQPVTGMRLLMAEPSYAGLYDFTSDGSVRQGMLSLADGIPSGDLGNPDRTSWAQRTRTYLNGSGADRNVVVWSWCGQVSDASSSDINSYLSLMTQLESDYPGVTFVYMTGHLDGTGVEGNLNQRNNQIRNHVRSRNKVLFDFADIESYDPDGQNYLDRGADDGCYYAGGNWAVEWCRRNPASRLCDSCGCAHSQPLNCNLKARAFWWLAARIAGWDGTENGGPAGRAGKGGKGRR